MDKVIIFGCGPIGLRTYEDIKADTKIVAFLDNDEQKNGTAIDGIYGAASEFEKGSYWG